MATISYSRQASPDEMAAEIDRRGRAIEGLEAERDRLAESEKFWKETAATESRARCDLQSELSTLKAKGTMTDAPPCWWIDHGTHGQITQREDEAVRAAAEGKPVISYSALPLVTEGWKPISSAPKDASLVVKQGDDVYSCSWREVVCEDTGRMTAGWWDHTNGSLEEPTHWLCRLPAAKEG